MKKNAYSLIEVLIAGSILLVGITAAALLANALFSQEIRDARITQAINLQTQAATLWQLGLEPGTITNILPAKCVSDNPPLDADAVYFSFGTGTTNIGGVDVERAIMDIVFPTAIKSDGNLVHQTNTVTLIRPQTR